MVSDYDVLPLGEVFPHRRHLEEQLAELDVEGKVAEVHVAGEGRIDLLAQFQRIVFTTEYFVWKMNITPSVREILNSPLCYGSIKSKTA